MKRCLPTGLLQNHAPAQSPPKANRTAKTNGGALNSIPLTKSLSSAFWEDTKKITMTTVTTCQGVRFTSTTPSAIPFLVLQISSSMENGIRLGATLSCRGARSPSSRREMERQSFFVVSRPRVSILCLKRNHSLFKVPMLGLLLEHLLP